MRYVVLCFVNDFVEVCMTLYDCLHDLLYDGVGFVYDVFVFVYVRCILCVRLFTIVCFVCAICGTMLYDLV